MIARSGGALARRSPSGRAAAANARPRAPPRVRAAAASAGEPAAAGGGMRVITRDEKFAFQALQKQQDKEQLKQPRPENAPGAFYVDHTCIDCSACRWVAPGLFSAAGPQAAVARQPETREERVAALQALLSCPVYAIHASERRPDELRDAQAALPRPWPTAAPGVYHCGWHSNASYGGAGWLLVRPGGAGNVLVDSPRYSPPLAKRIEELGGIKYIFLTHKDDVADHAKWAQHFGAARIIHASEATAAQGTDACEVQLTGQGPWPFPDGDDDLTLIHTPGHTSDHVVLYSARHKALFSGDHLSGIEDADTPWKLDGRLFVYTEFNWFSVPQQLDSVRKLLDYDWLHVLPGHGVPAALADASERLARVSELLAREGAGGAAAAAGAAAAGAAAAGAAAGAARR